MACCVSAAVDLQSQRPATVGVISELMNDDGTVMKGEQVARFADHNLKHVTIADIAYRQGREKLIEQVS